jgi:5-methylcytosine-specific restriction endonuclease McrA
VNRRYPKERPICLDAKSYRRLWREVLRRDGFRCQVCGSMKNLQVHHKKFRSQSGDDSDENLISLWVSCHRALHE